MVELSDIGKKIGQIIIPNAIFTGLLIGFKKFEINVTLEQVVIYNFGLAILYILLWQELRLRKVEKTQDLEEKTKWKKQINGNGYYLYLYS